MISINLSAIDIDTSPHYLRAIATMLNTLAGESTPLVAAHAVPAPRLTLAIADSPDAGVDTVPAATAIREPEVTHDAARVFGAPAIPNVVAAAPPIPVISAPPIASTPPAPPPVAPPVAASTAMLDSAGLPWDARINASTRTQTAKGVWKRLKGVDDATFDTIAAELRSALGAPPPPAFVPLNAQVPAPPAPTDVPAPPAPIVATAAPTTFAEICQFVTSHAIPPEKTIAACQKFGLPGLGLAAVRLDLIPSIYAELCKP
jgi:hypothetical protein